MPGTEVFQPAVLLLAAGNSSRFNGIKQLAQAGDKYLLQHAVDRIAGLPGSPKVVALGANSEVISEQIQWPDTVQPLHVANWQEGIAASIRAGVSQLRSSSHVLVLLADQPDINEADIHALLQKSRSEPDAIVCARYANRNAVPAIFPGSDYALLLSLSGDHGAGRFLNHQNYQSRVAAIDMHNGAIDIDTRQDLHHWQQQTEG